MDDMLTLVEVAERTGTSKVTARRYLDAGKFPGAVRENGRGDGRWLVPWSDVLGSGLARKKTGAAQGPEGDRTDDPLIRTLEAQARTIEAQARLIESQAQTIERLSGRVERLLNAEPETNRGT
jgi:hypothetical protein